MDRRTKHGTSVRFSYSQCLRDMRFNVDARQQGRMMWSFAQRGLADQIRHALDRLAHRCETKTLPLQGFYWFARAALAIAGCNDHVTVVHAVFNWFRNRSNLALVGVTRWPLSRMHVFEVDTWADAILTAVCLHDSARTLNTLLAIARSSLDTRNVCVFDYNMGSKMREVLLYRQTLFYTAAEYGSTRVLEDLVRAKKAAATCASACASACASSYPSSYPSSYSFAPLHALFGRPRPWTKVVVRMCNMLVRHAPSSARGTDEWGYQPLCTAVDAMLRDVTPLELGKEFEQEFRQKYRLDAFLDLGCLDLGCNDLGRLDLGRLDLGRLDLGTRSCAQEAKGQEAKEPSAQEQEAKGQKAKEQEAKATDFKAFGPSKYDAAIVQCLLRAKSDPAWKDNLGRSCIGNAADRMAMEGTARERGAFVMYLLTTLS
jgi:hypothetical protein